MGIFNKIIDMANNAVGFAGLAAIGAYGAANYYTYKTLNEQDPGIVKFSPTFDYNDQVREHMEKNGQRRYIAKGNLPVGDFSYEVTPDKSNYKVGYNDYKMNITKENNKA